MSLPEPAQPPEGFAHEAFVGRAVELAALERLLGEALQQSGRVVFVSGDAGMGKTLLVREFLSRARRRQPPLTLFRARCVEQYGAREAYLPFLDGLAQLLKGRARERTLELLRRHAPTWQLQLASEVGSADAKQRLELQTIGATKERMLREMGDLFAAVSRVAPVFGVIEDLQWADPSTVDLLRHLAERVPRQPMLVLATFRPAGLTTAGQPLKSFVLDVRAQPHCHELALGPLSEGDVAAYVAERFSPNRFAPEVAQLIHRKSDGHPLYVSSLAQFLIERGDLQRVGGCWSLIRELAGQLDAPESVRAAVRSKLEALAEDDRAALQCASVQGREFLGTVLAAVMNIEELALEERLRRLDRNHRLIDTLREEELPDGSLATRYRFANGLYHDVLYDDLVSKRRILLHRQIAEQLVGRYRDQAPRIAGQLALHFERGRDFPAALSHLGQSADNAARLYAYGEAQQLLEHALELLAKLPAEEQGRRAVALHERLGAMSHARGRFARAAEDFGRMLSAARALGAPAQEFAALAGQCRAFFFSHRIAEAALRAHEALDVAAKARSETLRIEALTLVALVLQDEGRLAESKPLLDEVIEASRRLDYGATLLAGLAYRGSVHYWQSEYVAAEAAFIEALRLANELRDGFLLLACRTFLGLSRGHAGRMGEALQDLEAGIETARRNGDRFWLPRLLNHVGWVHRELQDFGAAIERDQEGRSLAREAGSESAEIGAIVNLAYDFTGAGRLEDAQAAFRELEALSRAETWYGWNQRLRSHVAYAEYWLQRGQADEAEAQARTLLEAALRHDARTYALSAHRLLARASLARGDVSAAAVHLVPALDPERSLLAPLEGWKAHATLGQVLACMNEAAGAREAYGQAAALVRQIASNIAEEALRARFLASAAVRQVLDGAGGEG